MICQTVQKLSCWQTSSQTHRQMNTTVVLKTCHLATLSLRGWYSRHYGEPSDLYQLNTRPERCKASCSIVKLCPVSQLIVGSPHCFHSNWIRPNIIKHHQKFIIIVFYQILIWDKQLFRLVLRSLNYGTICSICLTGNQH